MGDEELLAGCGLSSPPITTTGRFRPDEGGIVDSLFGDTELLICPTPLLFEFCSSDFAPTVDSAFLLAFDFGDKDFCFGCGEGGGFRESGGGGFERGETSLRGESEFVDFGDTSLTISIGGRFPVASAKGSVNLGESYFGDDFEKESTKLRFTFAALSTPTRLGRGGG